MRKAVVRMLILIFSFFTIWICIACHRAIEQKETKTYIIEFITDQGGTIEGKAYQKVKEGENTEKVVAVAAAGYYFVGWSDYGYDCFNEDESVTRNERIIENVHHSRGYFAMFAKIDLCVSYESGGNGSIAGALVQHIKYGESGTSVTAVPNKGYRFVGWSDGLTNDTRSEVELTENKHITADFEIISNTYTYNYKFADDCCDEQDVTLTYGRLSETKLAVPKRDHATFGGWYADRFLTVPIADEAGNIVVDDEFFYTDCDRFYAKWNGENTHQYKILIVYVTELHAKLRTNDYARTVQVDYVMTETERRICHMITERLEFELDDLAVADFVVDEYFTTVPLTKDNFREDPDIYGQMDNAVWPYHIPEIQEIRKQYDSVLSSFSMNDYSVDLHTDAGAALAKYGHVHCDALLSGLVLNNEKLENLFDRNYHRWDSIIRTYWHELAHTIEMRVNNLYNFHETIDYIWKPDCLLDNKLYFLNKAVVNNETVGIPYAFWQGKVATVFYEAQENASGEYMGYIEPHPYHDPTLDYVPNHDVQYVIYNDDAISVKANAFPDYEFIGWSDGIQTPTRQDKNITEDLHVYALFRKKSAS